jgi:hypothetical protein
MSAKILREARAQQAELDLEDAEEEVAALGGQAVRGPGCPRAAFGAWLQLACTASTACALPNHPPAAPP